jgi:hypothetical protein
MEYSWDYAKTKMLEDGRNTFTSKTFGPNLKYRIKNGILQYDRQCVGFFSSDWIDSRVTDKLCGNYTWEIVDKAPNKDEFWESVSPYVTKAKCEYTTHRDILPQLSLEMYNYSRLNFSTPEDVSNMEKILAAVRKYFFPDKKD